MLGGLQLGELTSLHLLQKCQLQAGSAAAAQKEQPLIIILAACGYVVGLKEGFL